VTSPADPSPLGRRHLSERIFLAAFGAFVASALFSLAGAGLLTYAPGLAAPALAWISVNLGVGLETLIKAPTWVNMGMLPILAFALFFREMGAPDGKAFDTRRAWLRSLAFLAAGSLIGATSELVGTQTGFPFGAYSYGDFLGPKIAGHVPWLIPPSWYALSLVSYDLARRLGAGTAGRVLGTALFMVLWDVALDPAMNHAFPFWRYETGGVYFGMPLVNWAGWALTSVVIACAYEMLGGLRSRPQTLVERWSPRYYAANSLFSVGVCVAYGAFLAAIAGAAALAIALGLVQVRRGPAAETARARTGLDPGAPT
jgi:putative membrane protein